MVRTQYSEQQKPIQALGSNIYLVLLFEEKINTIDEDGNDAVAYSYVFYDVKIESLTENSLTEAILSKEWSTDYENKLINDYNAAKMGLLEGDKYEKRYYDWLKQRNELKTAIKQAYAEK